MMRLSESSYNHNTTTETHNETYNLYAENGKTIRWCAVCGYIEEIKL